jgi:hypothetical protein
MIILLTRGESYKEIFTSSIYGIYTCYSVGEIAFTFTTRKFGGANCRSCGRCLLRGWEARDELW